jgi:hypothetical protein
VGPRVSLDAVAKKKFQPPADVFFTSPCVLHAPQSHHLRYDDPNNVFFPKSTNCKGPHYVIFSILLLSGC